MRPRILVIRGGAIGDFVLTLPAIKLLRENFPDAHLEILGYKHIVALAEGRYYADATRSIEYAALSRFFIPDTELAPDLIEYFGSFQQIVSYLFDPDQFFENNLRRCGVKHFLHISPKLDDSAHAAQQLARPLESLALYLEDASATLHPNDADKKFADEFFAKSKILCSKIIAIHPGSGNEKKNWPLQNWLALGDWLFTLSPQPALLLIGGEADYATLNALRSAWKNQPLLVARDLPLHHLAALLERVNVFIGHDSGISHIAAAAGARCVLLFGPTDPDIWAPANKNVRTIASAEADLAKLEVNTVKAALAESLQ